MEQKNLIAINKGSFSVEESQFTLLTSITLIKVKYRHRVSFSVNLVDEQIITELNSKYRNEQGPTDVISFALEDAPAFVNPPDMSYKLLGDIYICIPVVKKNASANNTAFKHELEFVFVHSLLHLLGFDHDNEQTNNEMNELTLSIINTAKP